MFPHGGFDEPEFRRHLSEEAEVQAFVLPLVDGGLDTWVQEAKRFYCEGF
jgi:hypothetical protein